MGVIPEDGARRSDPRGQRVPRGRAARRRRRWPSTSAAATTGASGTPRAATIRSPRSCSTSSTSICSCWSTSPSAPARSSRCASCRANKGVVLGLVSSKVPAARVPGRSCIRRIEDASRYVPLDNLALSPQCGFASSLEGNLLTEDEQWQKLQLVADTARKVWNDDIAWPHFTSLFPIPSFQTSTRPARCWRPLAPSCRWRTARHPRASWRRRHPPTRCSSPTPRSPPT